jgi:hypothetical protein
VRIGVGRDKRGHVGGIPGNVVCHIREDAEAGDDLQAIRLGVDGGDGEQKQQDEQKRLFQRASSNRIG